MRLFRSDPFRLLVILIVTVVAGAACVQPDEPEVGLSKIEAELVFGVVIEEDKPVTTPAKAVADAPEQPDFDFGEDEPFEIPDDYESPIKLVEDCPTAPRGASSEKPATNFVDGDPLVGLYRWKIDTVRTDPATGTKSSTEKFEKRIIRNFERLSDSATTFEMVQPNPADSGTFLVSTFEVYTDKLQVNPTAGVPAVDSPVKPGDPERGVVLKRVEIQNSSGQTVGQGFAPRSGLLMLPIPVRPNEQYQSVGVDPRGDTIVHDAVVKNIVRIDACGEVIDGWLVEAHQSISNAEGTEQIRYDYIVAPQYGGMVISERIRPSEGDAFDILYTQGQREPDPLPAGNQ